MENLVFEKQAALAAAVKPGDLSKKGFLVVPFDALNTSFTDLASVYLKPSLPFSVYRKLSKVNIVPVDGMDNMLNVFTAERYTQFLQMICRENYQQNRNRHITIDFEVISGPAEVDCSTLPIVKNTQRGREIFEHITRTSYSVFSSSDVWVVKCVTRFIEFGRERKLCEFNVFLPEGACLQ